MTPVLHKNRVLLASAVLGIVMLGIAIGVSLPFDGLTVQLGLLFVVMWPLAVGLERLSIWYEKRC